ncbi:DUF4402 domain-containing protein [Novosphingobium sp. Fuku2-ISO-50]|uniref:DUF4402 domain-containing protein n=1 Tax=Novosphingobium sp. Fuku2-ISO-50 TaxID=1739114 RepID=UPI0018D1FA9A|nr:DUF4402 domain-containing protein [Novosphingobium sp. Fuku2-ISO-50]
MRHLAVASLAMVVMAPAAHADSPSSFTATADQALSFGTIVTSGSGSRTVGPDGSTTNNGVFPLGDSASGPAQFTMTYTRASGDPHLYQLLIQVMLPTVSPVRANGVQGSLSGFTTDLPGVPTLLPGQAAVFTMPNCVSKTCSITFHVGSTLNVVSGNTGAKLTFPLMLMTTVTAVLG